MLQQLSAMGFPPLTPAAFESRLAAAGNDFELLVAMLLTGSAAEDVREAMQNEDGLDDACATTMPAATQSTPASVTSNDSVGHAAAVSATAVSGSGRASDPSCACAGSSAKTTPAATQSTPATTSVTSSRKCPCPDCTCGAACTCLEKQEPQCDSCATFVKDPAGHAAAVAAVSAASATSGQTAAVRPKGPLEGESLPEYLARVGASGATAKTPAQWNAMTHEARQGLCILHFSPPG